MAAPVSPALQAPQPIPQQSNSTPQSNDPHYAVDANGKGYVFLPFLGIRVNITLQTAGKELDLRNPLTPDQKNKIISIIKDLNAMFEKEDATVKKTMKDLIENGKICRINFNSNTKSVSVVEPSQDPSKPTTIIKNETTFSDEEKISLIDNICRVSKELLFSAHPQTPALKLTAPPPTSNATIPDIGIQRGNTNNCYMIAGIQQLRAMPNFINLVRGNLTQQAGESIQTFKARQAVQEKLKNILDRMQFGNKNQEEIAKAMNELREVIFSENVKGKNGLSIDLGADIHAQHDGATFLEIVLKALGQEFEIRKTLNFDHNNQPYKKEMDPEPTLKLALNFENSANLQGFINSYFSQVDEVSTTPYKLSIGNQEVSINNYRSKYNISKIPDCLNIQIKRFDNQGKKILTSVDCNSGKIQLSNAFDPPGQPRQYNVTGFQVHNGDSPTQGHYIAYRLCEDGKWRRFNDEAVKEIAEKEALEEMGSAYNLTLVACSL